MSITPEYLKALKQQAVQRKEQLVADLNAALGEIRTLEWLITESSKEPENPDLN